MNFEFFKDKITEKFSSQENFANKIGVSRRTLLNWFSKKSIPNEHLFSILELLDLSESDENTLLSIPKLQLVFRTKHKMTARQKSEELCQNVASSFMKLDSTAYETKSAIPILSNPSIETAVASIKNLLSLRDDVPATLTSVLETLKANGPRVIFFPFNRIGIDIQTQGREVAFTAVQGDKRIIFLDTNRRVDEVLFDLIHELTHIVCGHPSNTSEDNEHFCNEVSQEIIYPRTFFLKNKKLLSFLQNCSKENFNRVKEFITLLMKDFDWSSMGIALALERYDHLSKASNSYKWLMAIDSQLKKQVPTFDDIHFSTFNKNDFDSLIKFFQNDIYKNKEIFSGFIELKNAAMYGHLSPSRLAELLGLNGGDADELVKSWIKDEDSEELHEEGQISDTTK
ncbi:MAG: ImmA/IrrE family metallo-endopeptidase [Oligoflexia bacterium]|nr:ImmA/IrrE family metallo-endopeptidase [Oligoflexia bacterium]